MTREGDLSQRQLDILSFLYSYTDIFGYAPSVREICEAVGLHSTSVVSFHLSRLESSGDIERRHGTSRTMSLPEINS